MPNVMATLPNIGGALCSTPQFGLTPTTRVPCSNAAKKQKPLKLPGVPQTNETISAASYCNDIITQCLQKTSHEQCHVRKQLRQPIYGTFYSQAF